MRRLLKCLYFVCILGYNFLNVYFAKVIMNITDSLSQKNSEMFFRYLEIGAVSVACLVILNFFSIYLQNKIVRGDMHQAQCKSFERILLEDKRELGEDEYDKDFLFLTKEMELYENNYVLRKLLMINSFILFFASTCMIFRINRKLMLVIMLLVIVMAVIPFVMNKKLMDTNEQYLEANKRLYSKTGEFLQGFETIKTFFAENEIMQKYSECVAENNEKKRILNNNLGFTNAITAFLGIVIVFVTFVFGGILIFNKELTIGAIFATVQLVTNMVNPFTDLLYGMNEINAVKLIVNKVQKNIRDEVKHKEYECTNDRTVSVKLKDVSFMYNNQKSNVINNLSVNFEQGKMYAIVGENGSGKSTIGKLIAGYNMDYSGTITMDGKELKNIAFTDLRKHIAYINQNPFVFDSTVYDNCTVFGKYNIKEENVRVFECERLLENIEMSAINLSGGEKQKLIFLRSLNLDFDIIIYDEAEASMDIISRKKLLEFLGKQKNKIVICISHAVDESLGMYDEIIYVKKGDIKEQGSFKQLYGKHGDFYDFYNKKIS